MTISASGIISGLNWENIISQLLDLERRPIFKLQQQEADYQVDLTAYGSLKGVLNSLQSAMRGLDTISDLTSFTASSSDADLVTVFSDSAATAGSYNITVTQMAKVHKLKSTAFAETEEVLEFKVDETNKYIDFKENGVAELTATFTEGSYTVSELEAEIKSQLETASDASGNSIDYTVSYDSSTKKFTITEDGSTLTELDLLWATGTNSAASLLGFAAEDDTGALEYTSDNVVGEGTIHLEIGNVFTIDEANNKIDFKEDGGAELTATITNGTYTISELETALKAALEAAGSVNYTVSYDNATQKFTIDDNGTLTQFDLLWKTGTNGSDGTDTSAASILGFSDTADDTGALEYTGDNEVGVVVDISISATDTVEDVADAINDANAGVKAAAIFDGTNYYLTMTAENSGDANVINLTVTDIDGSNTDTNSLSRLVYHKGGTENLTETQAAEDAIFDFDGVTNIHRDSNAIDDVVEGLTITLISEPGAPDNEATLTVSRDTSTVISAIFSFVNAYNTALDFFGAYQKYDEETKTVGILFGDSTTNLIRTRLRNNVSDAVLGIDSFSRLSDLGIALNNDGRLEVDPSTLDDATTDHFEDVLKFFTQTTEGSEGFAVRMVDDLESFLDSVNGSLPAREAGIRSSIDDINERVERLEARLVASETRMRSQFVALELLLSQYQTTSDFLSQQLTYLKDLNHAIS